MKKIVRKILARCLAQAWNHSVLAVLVIAGVLSSAMSTPARDFGLFSTEDQPNNVFAVAPFLPLNIQRVAVLPLACEEMRLDLPAGCEALNPIMLAELAKTKKFEVVAVNTEGLRSRTGRSSWTGTEVLPADFLDTLAHSYGCDAVLFCQLTVYHANAPLAVGYRLKLVDSRTKQTLWSADEVFNAEPPAAPRAANRFRDWWHLESQTVDWSAQEDWAKQNSPRQFGRRALARLLSTLPQR